MFYYLAILFTAVDLSTKFAIRRWLSFGETHVVRPGVLKFSLYENTGMSFSSMQGYATMFGVVATLFVAGVVVYRMKQSVHSRLQDIGLALLVAGAAGNGIERLGFGKVTDFIMFGDGSGVMNIADLMINGGVLLVVLQLLLAARSGKRADMGAIR